MSAECTPRAMHFLRLLAQSDTQNGAGLAGRVEETGTEDCRLRALRVALAAAIWIMSLTMSPLHAVEAVNVRVDIAAIDLTDAVEQLKSEGGRIQVSTAPGSDGIVRRIEVPAREAGANWADFALANSSDEQIDRLIVVPHYQMVGSKILWPDLGLSRVVNITPSARIAPPPTSSASPSIPAPWSPTSWSFGRTSCHRSIFGSRIPTRTRSTASRSTMAS